MQNGNGNLPPWPVPTTTEPLFGLWQPNLSLKHLSHGEGCVRTYLLNTLPSPESKVCIVTGKSLAEKTPVVRKLEVLLGSHHAFTISNIRQHGPSTDVDAALEKVLQDDSIDTLISVGGGSPIDTAKSIAYRVAGARGGKWLCHIAIPTTLSAAECTPGGGYTKPDGVKVGFMAPEMAVRSIFYDPYFASYTPTQLWLTTGMRAMDHAVECFYHPYGSEVWKVQSLWAAQTLFEYLPKARDNHPSDPRTTTMLQLAAFMSSGLKGGILKGGMGLSHSLGHALGSPYGLPHGVTSCLTLGRVVQLKARGSEADAKQIARLLPAMGVGVTGDVRADALAVGERILELVNELGIAPGTLTALGVAQDQIPIITSRACGGAKDGLLHDAVFGLVKSLF